MNTKHLDLDNIYIPDDEISITPSKIEGSYKQEETDHKQISNSG